MSNRIDQINLLPRSEKQRSSMRRWCSIWGFAIMMAFSVSIFGIIVAERGGGQQVQDLEHQVDSAIQEITQRQSSKAVQPGPVLVDHGSHDRRETQPRHWGELLSGLARMSGSEVGFDLIDVALTQDHSILIEIQGVAIDSQDVLSFAATVERSGMFGPMSSPTITLDPSQRSVRFEMSAVIPAVASVQEGSP